MLTSNLLNCVRIYRGALWILGEYCSTKEDIQSVMTEVRRSLGEVCMCAYGLFIHFQHSIPE